ncbi:MULTISPECIES: hypothetical protein [unclassified Marinobacter]|jgi:hypothetical protein|uniref:hypothetical protein n=1 Tax=unclassified Marinobacter TaxID=83889 RepID=UPI000C607852|nr:MULTISPECIES: hypothetical protein [unclassified Marinobacter]MAB52969.1 hypothetical protein [Marinobacter sp.]MBN14023.1 hypothetical protein [Pelagibacterium sp.]|tara:strand:- start:1133 stop:1387 length:255 start_codon:yes stop_codon:yes gene_type:complete
MKYTLSQISLLLKEALAVAETFEHFKSASVSLELSCSDGSIAAVTETIDNPGDDTDNSGSSITHTPRQKSLVDQLGDIKTNTWF